MTLHTSILLLVLCACCELTAQTPDVLDIDPGWTRDSAMAVLKGKYRVADTMIWVDDFIIRMAPVRYAGYDGYFALHTDRAGYVTSCYWVRRGLDIYINGAPQWREFNDWKSWSPATVDDFDSLSTRIDAWWHKRLMRQRPHTSDDTGRSNTRRGAPVRLRPKIKMLLKDEAKDSNTVVMQDERNAGDSDEDNKRDSSWKDDELNLRAILSNGMLMVGKER